MSTQSVQVTWLDSRETLTTAELCSTCGMSPEQRMSPLTFIIPVRHQDNARDWALLKANLTQTAASIASQTHPGWRALVVANEGADLPDLPAGSRSRALASAAAKP